MQLESTVERLRVTVHHPSGLHARPAARFVEVANQYRADITVANPGRGTSPVNAKSILGVLTLGVNQGTEIELTATGEDGPQALAALRELIESNFGEDE